MLKKKKKKADSFSPSYSKPPSFCLFLCLVDTSARKLPEHPVSQMNNRAAFGAQ